MPLRLRKQLQHLYLVHPTFWVRTMLQLLRPFISRKFYRKVHSIRSLQELSTHISIDDDFIPAPVLRYVTHTVSFPAHSWTGDR